VKRYSRPFDLGMGNYSLISGRMKLRRKTPSCLNCGQVLTAKDNFCSHCGQENTDGNLTLGMLSRDLIADTVPFDSSFFRSIFPFLFKPGYLSLMHMGGKRISYISPLRFYLIISVVFFFFLSITIFERTDNTKLALSPQEKELLEQNTDSLLQELQEQEINELATEKHFVDSIRGINIKMGYETDTSTASSKIFNSESLEMFNKYYKNPSITDSMLLDSMKEDRPFFQYIVKQVRKVRNDDTEAFVSAILKNIPIMMLILIPIFALILKLLYIRNQHYLFINHLTHGIHLHSYSYLVYAVGMIFLYYNPTWEFWTVFLVCFSIATVYTYFSFMRFYNQGWFKTILKFAAVGYVYVLFIFFFLLAEMFVSFLFY